MKRLKGIYISAQHMQPGEGSFTHVNEIVNRLNGFGHHVRLYVPQYRRGRPALGIRLMKILALHIRSAAAILFNRELDFVYLRYHPLLPFLPWLSRFRRIPVLVEINGPQSDLFDSWPLLTPFSNLANKVAGLGKKRADICICVTEEIRTDVLASGVHPDRCVVITNGANTDLFSPAPADEACRRIGIDPADKYFCFVGAYSPWQGIEVILDAVQLVVERGRREGWGILFAGGGVLEGQITEAGRDYPIIRHLGRLPQAKVADVINASAAGIVAQTSPGRSPLKMFEYMACARPVITTDIPASDFVIQHDAGIVVPRHDAEALARAFVTVLEDESWAEAAGRRGYAAVVKEQSWHAVAVRIETVLKDLVKDARCSDSAEVIHEIEAD